MTEFEKKLQSLININCEENESNTPDFILAQYLGNCLKAFNRATQQRETWNGRDARPSHHRYGVAIEKDTALPKEI